MNSRNIHKCLILYGSLLSTETIFSYLCTYTFSLCLTDSFDAFVRTLETNLSLQPFPSYLTQCCFMIMYFKFLFNLFIFYLLFKQYFINLYLLEFCEALCDFLFVKDAYKKHFTYLLALILKIQNKHR